MNLSQGNAMKYTELVPLSPDWRERMQLLLLETFILLVTHFDTVPANAGIIYRRVYKLVSPSSLRTGAPVVAVW